MARNLLLLTVSIPSIGANEVMVKQLRIALGGACLVAALLVAPGLSTPAKALGIFNGSSVTGSLAAAGVDFFDFVLPTDVCATCPTHFVKFDTIGSNFDTELGLFVGFTGDLITFDDDRTFFDLTSLIEIGKDIVLGPTNDGGLVPFLAAGGYTLAICSFPCSFANGFAVSSGGPGGDYTITVMVPEPTTLAIFGLGLVGLGFFMRRRRILN